jgi:DnaK suppressor protein
MPSPVHPQEGLVAQRAELAALAAELRADLAGLVAASAGANADDEHDPEGATIAFERAQTAALLERTEARIDELDVALNRVADGSYGTCVRCGRPIGADRLAARPGSTTCIDCAGSRRG